MPPRLLSQPEPHHRRRHRVHVHGDVRLGALLPVDLLPGDPRLRRSADRRRLPHPHGGGGGGFDDGWPVRDAVRAQAARWWRRSPSARSVPWRWAWRFPRTARTSDSSRDSWRSASATASCSPPCSSPPRPGCPTAEQGIASGHRLHRLRVGAAVGLAVLVLVATAGLDGLTGERCGSRPPTGSAPRCSSWRAESRSRFLVAVTRCPTPAEPAPAPVPYQTRRC